MPDRRRQIETLLWGLYDFSYEPLGFTAKVVNRSAKRGPSPSAWKPCDTCNGEGTRRDRYGTSTPCETCHGRGRRKVDDYTGEEVIDDTSKLSFAQLLARDTKHVTCPDCQDLAGNATGVIRGERCRRCDGTGQASVPGSWLSEPRDETSGGDPVDAMLTAIERRRQIGSFHALEQGLAGLTVHVNKPVEYDELRGAYARALITSVYVTRIVERADLEDAARLQLDLGMAYLDWRMPVPILVPAGLVAAAKREADHRTRAKGRGVGKQALQRRDKEIIRHARDGRGSQWIAAEYGLSVRSVNEIVNGVRREDAA